MIQSTASCSTHWMVHRISTPMCLWAPSLEYCASNLMWPMGRSHQLTRTCCKRESTWCAVAMRCTETPRCWYSHLEMWSWVYFGPSNWGIHSDSSQHQDSQKGQD